MFNARFSSRCRLIGKSIVVLGCLTGASQTHGMDSYDGTYLNIPLVSSGGRIFTDVVITVGDIIAVGPKISNNYTFGAISVNEVTSTFQYATTSSADSYDSGTGQLFIPSVLVGNNAYSNVKISVGNIVAVGGVASPPSFLLVANPNDQAIHSYGYTTSPMTVSSINDPALASIDSRKQAQLIEDEASGLLFDIVPLSSGSVTITPFAFNPVSGSLASSGGSASTYPAGSTISVDVNRHLVHVLTSANVTHYPYSTSTGAIQSPGTTQTSSIFSTLFATDWENGLVFGSSNFRLSSYSVGPTGSISLSPAATIPSAIIPNSGSGKFVDVLVDQTHKILFVSVTTPPANNVFSDYNTLSAIPYTQTTFGSVGSPISLRESVTSGSYGANGVVDWLPPANVPIYACGVDPANQILFAPYSIPNTFINGLNFYTYLANGTMESPPVQFITSNPAVNSIIVNGISTDHCVDIDPLNKIIFYSSPSGPSRLEGGIQFFVYNKNGVVPSIPAGFIMLTMGPANWTVMSTRSANPGGH